MKNQYKKSLEDKILEAVKKGLELASTSVHVFVNDEEVYEASKKASKKGKKERRATDRRKS